MDEVAGSQILQVAQVLKENNVGVAKQHLSRTQTLLCLRGSDLKIAEDANEAAFQQEVVHISTLILFFCVYGPVPGIFFFFFGWRLA